MSENLTVQLFFLVQILFAAFVIYVVYRRRQARMAEFSKVGMANGDIYHGKSSNTFRSQIINSGHKLFRKGSNRRVNHLFEVPFDDGWMTIFEYGYEEGGSDDSSSKQTYHAVLIEAERLPFVQFSVEWEMARHQIKSKLGLQTKDIDFEMYPDFSERFFLRGEDETAVRDLFSDDVIRWFEETPHMHQVSLIPPSLLLYCGGKLHTDEIETIKQDAFAFYNLLTRQKSDEHGEEKWQSENDW